MISKTILASIIGIIIVGGVLGYQFYENSWIKSSAEEYYKCNDGKCDIAHVTYPENPQVLYGLQINKDKYVLGENIFVKITLYYSILIRQYHISVYLSRLFGKYIEKSRGDVSLIKFSIISRSSKVAS